MKSRRGSEGAPPSSSRHSGVKNWPAQERLARALTLREKSAELEAVTAREAARSKPTLSSTSILTA